ncbi:MAG: mRNA interferase MazF [Acidobacteriota bacterium]|nr:mRNA interferase MazF [Acidobacteriota bacterium]
MATILKLDIGDIVNIDLNPVRGEEKNKIRPCIILQNQITPLRLVTVLPITDDNGRRNSLFFCPIPDFKKAGLTKPSVVDCYQIRTVSVDRILYNKLGNAREIIDEIKSRLANILEISIDHVL